MEANENMVFGYLRKTLENVYTLGLEKQKELDAKEVEIQAKMKEIAASKEK